MELYHDKHEQLIAAARQKQLDAAIGTGDRDKTPLESELDALQISIKELDHTADWLLQRIQPVLQPAPTSNPAQEAKEQFEPSSSMRARLRALRDMVDATSARIAGVRYTIEL